MTRDKSRRQHIAKKLECAYVAGSSNCSCWEPSAGETVQILDGHLEDKMPASPCYLGGRREDWQAVGTTAGNENLKLLDTTGEQLEINGTAAVAWKPLGAQGVLHERRVATVRCALVAQGSAASLGAAPCTGED
eukprot:CAMPEP_0195573880 /NCGR_PEP_ID=MMETSP0814-20130614/5616_1 /TAXON_ID=97485 /ORGANISM="Prymnesium parvum, Strain Texoma1" /LENGTH=133 /DNA_ID=CAMNT_0040709809 /DNA_START=36 /DNA_END=435 /DNA_ORIENTATION=-